MGGPSSENAFVEPLQLIDDRSFIFNRAW